MRPQLGCLIRGAQIAVASGVDKIDAESDKHPAAGGNLRSGIDGDNHRQAEDDAEDEH